MKFDVQLVDDYSNSELDYVYSAKEKLMEQLSKIVDEYTKEGITTIDIKIVPHKLEAKLDCIHKEELEGVLTHKQAIEKVKSLIKEPRHLTILSDKLREYEYI